MDTGYLALMGLIPARAGTTVFLISVPVMGWAHPRSRGDHCAVRPVPNVDAGSSPLARGPHLEVKPAVSVYGLIPARAGTTNYVDITDWNAGAHPRSRGDHWT